MKKYTIIILSVLISLSSLTSCATLFSGSKQTVTFNSEPPGATIEVDGIPRGNTPAPVKLKRKGQVVSLKKSGYMTKVFEPERSFNGVSVLNLFNILFWGIDAATGSINRYSPKYYNIMLQKKDANNQ